MPKKRDAARPKTKPKSASSSNPHGTARRGRTGVPVNYKVKKKGK